MTAPTLTTNKISSNQPRYYQEVGIIMPTEPTPKPKQPVDDQPITMNLQVTVPDGKFVVEGSAAYREAQRALQELILPHLLAIMLSKGRSGNLSVYVQDGHIQAAPVKVDRI